MASYSIRNIPLDAVFTRMEIQPPGQKVPDVGIQFLPQTATGNVDLHVGAGGDPIPLFLMGQNIHSTPSENTGIYLSNREAQPGAVIILIIGYEVQVITERQP